AVRPGHADQRVAAEQAVTELDLAPNRDSARTRGGGERRLGRHARALDHDLDTVEQRLLLRLRSEGDFDAEAREPSRVDGRRVVCRDDATPMAGQGRCGSPAGASEAEHEHAPGQPRLVRTRPAHGERSPPWGARGPLREAYVRGCGERVE